ncbi:MAG: CysS/YqeB C-terminal domain-containing protein, partial [Aestuariivirgaceae bacterium]
LGFSGNLTDPRQSSVDAQKIASLITARSTARSEKNWVEADRLRDELDAMGIQLKDSKNPETGEIETTWEVKR